MEELGNDIWLQTFELKVMGANIGRNVTIMRLPGGDLVVHSTGPFQREHVEAIHHVGRVRWILDSMLDHDTYAREGRTAFPEADYYGPPGLDERVHIPVKSLTEPPAEWQGQLEALELEGAPGSREFVFLHVASRTLIVTDLIFNFPHPDSLMLKVLANLGTKGGMPGVSRRFQFGIKDRDRFCASLRKMMEWDFDRLIVGHGDPIQSGAKECVQDVLERADLA